MNEKKVQSSDEAIEKRSRTGCIETVEDSQDAADADFSGQIRKNGEVISIDDYSMRDALTAEKRIQKAWRETSEDDITPIAYSKIGTYLCLASMLQNYRSDFYQRILEAEGRKAIDADELRIIRLMEAEYIKRHPDVLDLTVRQYFYDANNELQEPVYRYIARHALETEGLYIVQAGRILNQIGRDPEECQKLLPYICDYLRDYAAEHGEPEIFATTIDAPLFQDRKGAKGRKLPSIFKMATKDALTRYEEAQYRTEREEAEKHKDTIPAFSGIRGTPETSYILTTKLSNNEDYRSFLKTGSGNISIIAGTETIATCRASDLAEMALGPRVTRFQLDVLDTVVSIYNDADKDNEHKCLISVEMTANQIARAMAGKKSDYHVSKELLQQIEDALWFMTHLPCSIASEEELEIRAESIQPYMQGVSYGDDGFLITGVRRWRKDGGSIKRVWVISASPIQIYAMQTGQILSYETKYREVREVDKKGRLTETTVSTSITREIINKYLIGRVELIVAHKVKSNRILVDSIMRECVIPASRRAQAIEFSRLVLENLRANGKFYTFISKKSSSNRKTVEYFSIIEKKPKKKATKPQKEANSI